MCVGRRNGESKASIKACMQAKKRTEPAEEEETREKGKQAQQDKKMVQSSNKAIKRRKETKKSRTSDAEWGGIYGWTCL